jgi:gamma-glutamylaminecyclotransferase
VAHRVFVFGTLKEGFPNFAVNRGARMPGRFCTRERFPLYLVGDRHVPWMLDAAGEGEQVWGELYEVDEATLAAMDRFERTGEPDGYRRSTILIEGDDAGFEAFAYLKPASQLEPGQARTDPLSEYTLEHARLYRPRSVLVED